LFEEGISVSHLATHFYFKNIFTLDWGRTCPVILFPSPVGPPPHPGIVTRFVFFPNVGLSPHRVSHIGLSRPPFFPPRLLLVLSGIPSLSTPFPFLPPVWRIPLIYVSFPFFSLRSTPPFSCEEFGSFLSLCHFRGPPHFFVLLSPPDCFFNLSPPTRM